MTKSAVNAARKVNRIHYFGAEMKPIHGNLNDLIEKNSETFVIGRVNFRVRFKFF